MSVFGLVSFVGVAVLVVVVGWYCLGKGSVWREHEMLEEVDLFFKVIEVV